MTLAELVLRMVDVGRPEPAEQVLDRLEAEGHARNGFCEKCWSESGRDAVEYFATLDRVEGRTA